MYTVVFVRGVHHSPALVLNSFASTNAHFRKSRVHARHISTQAYPNLHYRRLRPRYLAKFPASAPKMSTVSELEASFHKKYPSRSRPHLIASYSSVLDIKVAYSFEKLCGELRSDIHESYFASIFTPDSDLRSPNRPNRPNTRTRKPTSTTNLTHLTTTSLRN